MIDFILSLPDWLGIIIAMLFTTGVGLLVYAISYKLTSKYQSRDFKSAASSLFYVIGVLVSLMLSLAFGEVVVEWRDIQNAIKLEVKAITDTFVDLQLYDLEGTREIRILLIDYAQAVIDDDWPALADDRLGERARALKQQHAEAVLGLEPANPVQEELKSRILDEVDLLSDARTRRLNAALAQPPIYTYVIFLGFLITMTYFGIYSPEVPLIAFVALYTAFVGLALYLILSLSDPFQGGIGLDPTPFEVLVETLGSLDN